MPSKIEKKDLKAKTIAKPIEKKKPKKEKKSKSSKAIENAAKEIKLAKNKPKQKAAKKAETTTDAVFKKHIPSVIPKSYPADLIVAVKNLPEKHKQSDLSAAFAKFGTLTYIQKVSNKKAFVAFLKVEEAQAAKNANKIFVRGQKLLVGDFIRKRSAFKKTDEHGGSCDRTVLVFRVDANATEDEIKNHFKACGAIAELKSSKRAMWLNFKLTFEKAESVGKALKLHNTVVKDSTIHVRRASNEAFAWDMKRTIVLLNPNCLTKISGAQLEKVFKDCGEIESCDVFCEKKRLAMVCFKNEQSVQKALSLNGTKKQDIDIQIESYAAKFERQGITVQQPNNEALKNLLKKSKKSKICLEKVADGLSEKDIANLFKTCGAVKSVQISADRAAVIEFDNVDGYCNAFALNECFYGGVKLRLKPFSEQEMPKIEFVKVKKEKGNFAEANGNLQPNKKLRKKA